MNAETIPALTRELDIYSQALRSLQPSEQLDKRIAQCIESWASTQKSQHLLRRPTTWFAVAGSLAVIATGVVLLAMRNRGDELRLMPPERFAGLPVQRSDVAALAAGQVSLWPADSQIFRVKASFASTAAVPLPGEAPQSERQYWVDVRIANDGTMRIMQVVPADGAHQPPLQ